MSDCLECLEEADSASLSRKCDSRRLLLGLRVQGRTSSGSSARLNEICKLDRRCTEGLQTLPEQRSSLSCLNTRAQAYPSSFCLHKERLAASSADLAVPKSGLERAESRKRRCETEAVPKKLCRLRGRAEEAVPKRLHVNGFWRAAFGVCANSLSGDAIGAQPLSLPLRQRRGG